MRDLARSVRLTVADSLPDVPRDTHMASPSNQLPTTEFALEVDGRIKTEFDTREGAESGAIALKRRFPDLQVRVYDASTKSRHEVQA